MTFIVRLNRERPGEILSADSVVVLELARAPLYLRFVRTAKGKWDALDQLDDEPAKGESIVAAKRGGEIGRLHMLFSRKRGGRRGAWYQTAEYRPVAMQPADDVMRDRAKWRAWCVEKAALAAPKEKP
ncbi:MAG TPA: hypothetical protein VGE52_12340 [Pirellulales bacterium]